MFLMTRLSLFLAIYLSACASISDARASRRSVAPPQTLEIPVKLDENQVYSVEVNMSSSTPQSFSFALSMSNAITTVAGVGCDSCGGVPSYNPSASSSVQQLPSQAQNVSLLSGFASGPLVRENCGLLQRNGSAWLYPNQTVTVANQSSSFFPAGGAVSGMIGLGPAPFAQSPAAHWLASNPAQPAFQVGFALAPPSNSNSSRDGGVLHWLSPDPDAHQDTVAQLPMRNATGTNVSQAEWFVEMDGWDASGRTSGSTPFNISQTGTPLAAILEPFYNNIVFPQSAARAIYANIPGASSLSWSTCSFTNAWKLPCDSEFKLTVTFGTFSTSLDQNSLVVPLKDGTCIGALQEWADERTTDYLLGAPFISAIYMIISYAQSGGGTLGLSSRADAGSKKLSGGALAGVVLGTIGVVALLVIAGVLVYGVWKRHRPWPRGPGRRFGKAWPTGRHKPSKTDVVPFPVDASPSPNAQYVFYRNHLGPGSHPNSPSRVALLGSGNGSNGHERPSTSSGHGHSNDHSTPNSSPDWQTSAFVVVAPDTNTFAGGTAPPVTPRNFRTTNAHLSYHTDVTPTRNSPPSIQDPDSPPPYMVPPAGNVALVPLRKQRRPS